MAKLIRELIEVPERVHKGDFVLRLSEGVEHPTATLRDYVVTEQLRESFHQAMDLVRRAVEGGRSEGAYLHGSFGSGKSHFMAVLSLLLRGNVEARSIPAMAPVVAKLGWAEGKKFLLVPYHLMGVDSLEQGILGRYAEYVRLLHPEAPVPAVYLAEPLFENAAMLRGQLGDERFFAGLNEGTVSGGWGKLRAQWDAATYAEALVAAPGDERRSELVSMLVRQFFPMYQTVAASREDAFVPLDRGLSVISKHARSLGYDGLVLFLDELILWLASRVADLAFVGREGAKVAKLVEPENPDRPVPIISFIARQRDLRDLVGDHLPGAEKLSFSDTLKWSQDRFATIRLEDRNLPAIAKHRLLRPRDEEARREVDRAFGETRKARAEVLSVLLGREGDPDSFRDVYPFSPALVQALVAISTALQRERTALRVMLQLLVDQRETLRLGDLVPMGDLFDVIAGGDEPFTEEMRVHFDRAKRLYLQKLLPMLERQHGLGREEVRALPFEDARAVAFRGHDRLLKTLLLAALAPGVEAFRAMTARRLAALNHGSIRSPVPGGEARMVLSQCRDWASQVGEIKIGDESNDSTIAIQLSGVDTESILEKVRLQDNLGNRKRVLRELLFTELGLPAEESLLPPIHTFSWRGTPRQMEVVFANIFEMANDSLRPQGGEWKFVIDYPFDTGGRTAKDDLAKLEKFRENESSTTSTFCWVPEFFSDRSKGDLGTYVVLDFLLTGDRFNTNASHLSEVDRAQARVLLENQQSQLKQMLIRALLAAYGVATDPVGLVDSRLELADRFQSLDTRFRPQPPAAASLQDAFKGLLDQILTYRFPKHPKFEMEVRPRELRKVLEVAQRAARAPQGRVEVERELRPVMRQIANPLGLGEMHEAAFVLSDYWRHYLTRGAALVTGPVTVAKLREAFQDDLGLPKEVENLLILVFAEQTNRSFFRHNAAVAPDLEDLKDDLEVREQRLPGEAVWNEAREKAAKVFGLAVPSFLSASGVSRLREEVSTKAAGWRRPAAELVTALRSWLGTFGGQAVTDGEGGARLRTAEAVEALVEALAAAKPDELLETLAAARIDTSVEAMGTSGSQAAALVEGLRRTPVDVLTGLQGVRDVRQPRAEAVLAELRDALERDELAVRLIPAVDHAVREGSRVLAMPVTPPEPAPPPPAGWEHVETTERAGLDADAAAELFGELDTRMREGGKRRLRIRWTIERRIGE